jgi:hypothetical protein
MTIAHVVDGETDADSAFFNPIIDAINNRGSGIANILDYPDSGLEGAYDDLPDGGGVVYLPPGRYDVGDGNWTSRLKPVEFVGTGRWGRGNPLISGDEAEYPDNDPVLYSSVGATSLFDLSSPASSNNGYGFAWKNLTFEVTWDSTDYAIFGPCLNSAWVDNCRFYFSDGATDEVIGIHSAVDDALGDDASWWRITNNTVSYGALCRLGLAGENSNRHVIQHNAIMGREAATTSAPPLVELIANHGSFVGSNNFERAYIGARFDACWGCHEIGDAGEQVKYFLDLDNATAACTFAPGGTSVASNPASSKVFRLSADAVNNIFILSAAATYGGFSGSYELEGGGWTGFNTWILPRQYGPTVTGSKASGAAFASFLSAYANYGLLVDSSDA